MSFKLLVLRISALACVTGLTACIEDSSVTSDASNDVTNDETSAIEQAATVAPSQQYFSVTRDQRLCASPRCGGYWVKAVNLPRTVCANGTSADSCYVAAIDYKALGGDPRITAATVIVKGRLTQVTYSGVGALGRLIAQDAWGSATAVTPTGVYYRLTDTGIVCVTEPCFTIKAEAINLGTFTTLSSYDFRKVGATKPQMLEAQQAMDDGRLIAAGTIGSTITPTTAGRQLVATQFYLPARDFCYSSDDCADAEMCNAADVCLPPPGCGPTTICPAVCTGYCVPRLGL